MAYKYAYVLEDGEIDVVLLVDEGVDVEDFVNGLCNECFDEEFHEVDEEKNGVLYTVNEVQQVFLSDIKTHDYEELFR